MSYIQGCRDELGFGESGKVDVVASLESELAENRKVAG